MEKENTSKNKNKLPEIIVFAGPNGNGKKRKTKYFHWQNEY